MKCIARPLRLPNCPRAFFQLRVSSARSLSSSARHHYPQHQQHDDRQGVKDEVPWLAKQPLHPLSLADLVRHGRPPLSAEALLSSARFTLSLLPIRLAHRIQALRNLPYIVVSNPNISKIYNNYQHSLSTLLPWQGRTISNLDDEIRFTEVLAELVHTHTDTIPILARGFLECRKYISAAEVTRFLDEHLRARIGTRLVAEQHIALHFSSTPHFDPGASPTPCPEHPNYIGVIDTALRPAATVDSCGGFVADICELNYGVRPQWVVDGEPDTTFAFVPMHLEYIVTELLKNAFRATVENGMNREPIVITIAPEPPNMSPQKRETVRLDPPTEPRGAFSHDAIAPLDDSAPGVTIRIRDRGGGISPDVLPHIWGYSFTTFGDDAADDVPGAWNDDALSVISAASGSGSGATSGSSGVGSSSIAGLGYGLPLSRAYAEYFGGGIAVQSLYGWGTDVYLRLKGVGKIE
ncbi:branched-chain alpha-ketoacid dehydrogenase [Lasiosphaeria miniovina]|uniref:Protein-serine/threonine kinase n=1 Tax=Lasiosphaeria miniovina TaxID=1954250 RepID=A0AA40ALL7_9PEZI|nr:branched-chain alpha-ketoacid dehydrogenase [Lasiosphaeria miniovina]KAK0718103.1 branched-chain alpha-ketoacid dehydrogenase [Lasiosphaeria miniovina]